MDNVQTKECKGIGIQEVNMVITLVIWLFLGVGGMYLMLYVASHKTVVILDHANARIDEIVEGQQGEGDILEANSLVFLKNVNVKAATIYIPLDKAIQAEDVMVENRYRDKELWIYIHGTGDDFYGENGIYGDLSPILSGNCKSQRGGVILKMQMNRVLEYYTTMEDNLMTITFKEPHDVYDYVAVIDPMGGGTEMGAILRGYAEKTLALQVANLVPDYLQRSDIKIYFTRSEDVNTSREERIALVEAVDADLYIRICAGSDEDSSRYGIFALYNEDYFIPQFGNVELADALTRSVTIISGNRALGIFAADEGSILQEFTIAAAQIHVGYLTNPAEGELLGWEEYRQKLAQGIAEAIEEVCADE